MKVYSKNRDNAQEEYIPVKISQINYYIRFPLYYKTADNRHVVYKPRQTVLTDERIDAGQHPQLFIHQSDRFDAIKQLQKGFNKQLKKI